MKKIFKNKTVVKFVIFLLLFAVAEVMRTVVRDFTKNIHYSYLFASIEIVFAVLMLKTAIEWVKQNVNSEKSVFGRFIGRITGRIFTPLVKLFRQKLERSDKRIYGTDERAFVIPWDISGKLKKHFDLREKINVKKCESNTEKIRMLYASLILKLNRNGYDIKYSRTPGEIKQTIKSVTIDTLFDTYEEIRYRKDAVADDETVRLCEEEEKRV